MSESPCTSVPSAFERFSRPGARHRGLAPMIGRWNVEMATHTAGQPDVVTRSREIFADKTWFGGERYVREEVRGVFSNSEHSKVTLLGYNNVRDRYEYLTADNHDAAIVFYASLPGLAGNGSLITLLGDYVYAGDDTEPVGTAIAIRTVIEIEGLDRHTLRNYYAAAGKAEYLFLEYIYTRSS